MSALLVDFVVRDDSESKGGGDLTQVEMYKEHLIRSGWDVRVVPFAPRMDLRPDAVVHLINVDRPYDALWTLRLAGPRPVFVSVIHHSLAAVRRMRGAERGLGTRSVLGRALPETIREYLAFVVRSLRRSRGLVDVVATMAAAARLLPAVSTCWTSLGRSLDRVDVVFLLAEGEGDDLAGDTRWSRRNAVIAPNGLPSVAERAVPWHERDDVILVVGRVEPRKRQLDIARAASGTATRLRFIGPLVHPRSAFGEAFRTAVATSPNTEWAGAMTHEAVLEEISSAKVLLNASWVEVQSLVELEASARGAWVVASSDAGNSAEYLGAGFIGVDDDIVPEMLGVAEELVRSMNPPPESHYPWTWEKTSALIEAEYLKRLGPTAR